MSARAKTYFKVILAIQVVVAVVFLSFFFSWRAAKSQDLIGSDSDSDPNMVAFNGQKQLVISQIEAGDSVAVEATMKQFVTEFSSYEQFPYALREIVEQSHIIGKIEEVKQLFQNLQGMQSQSEALIWLQMGTALVDVFRGDDASVEETVERMINQFWEDQRLIDAVDHVGWGYQKSYKYEDARAYYQYVVDTWPESEQAILSLQGVVFCHMNLRDENACTAAIDRLLIDYAGDERLGGIIRQIASEYVVQRRRAKAVELYQYVYETWPLSNDALWALHEIAYLAIKAKEFLAAEGTIAKIIYGYAGYQDLVLVFRKLSDEYQKVGEFQRALDTYQEVIRNWPESDEAMVALQGVVFCHMDLNEETACEAAIDRLLTDYAGDERLSRFIRNIADKYRSGGDHIRAIETFRTIQERWPHTYDALWSLRKISFLESQRGDYVASQVAEGEMLYEYAGHQDLPKIFRKLGDDYQGVGEFQRALDTYQEVIRNWPESYEAMLALRNIGRTYIDLDNPIAARAVFDELMVEYATDPMLPEAALRIIDKYPSKAIRLWNLNQRSKASEYYEEELLLAKEVIARSIQDPEVWKSSDARYFVAVAYFYAGASCHDLGRDELKGPMNQYFQDVIDTLKPIIAGELPIKPIRRIGSDFLSARSYRLLGDDQKAIGCFLRVVNASHHA